MRCSIIQAGAMCFLLSVATVPMPSSGQIAPLHWERQPIIVDTYRLALGRDPTSQELYYWVLYPDTPHGVINQGSLFAALLQTLKNSPDERMATAKRALSAAFEKEEAGSSRLRTYIEDGRNPPLRQASADLSAQRDGGGYRGLVAWLSRPGIREHFVEHTGMAAVMAPGPARP